MGFLNHLLDIVIPRTAPITNIMVHVTSTGCMLAVRAFALPPEEISTQISATTILVQHTAAAVSAICTKSTLDGRPIVLPGLGQPTITVTTLHVHCSPITISATNTGCTSVQAHAQVSSLLPATVTILLVRISITNTLVLAINTRLMSVVRTVVPGLGHQTITASTIFAQITPISMPAISTGNTSVVQTHALVSSHLVATVTTLLVPFTNTLVLAIYSSNMSLVRALVMGLGHRKTISATTPLALCTRIAAPATSTANTSDIPALALV